MSSYVFNPGMPVLAKEVETQAILVQVNFIHKALS